MSDVRQNVERLLGLGLENDALLSQLEPLAKDPEFAASADLWAADLYGRDPRYFAPFLARYLTADQASVIAELLPRIEADGQDDLFVALYKLAVKENGWNADLRAKVDAGLSDEALAHAVEVRGVVPAQFALAEDLAAALYARVPAAFARVLLPHVLPGRDWEANRDRDYAALRQAARARGDDAVYWRLFRAFATADEWKVDLMRLAQQAVPPERIVAELEQRRLNDPLRMDPATLVVFLDQYGAALAPFIDANLDWFGRLDTALLLEAIERTGDAALFRRVFFRYADNAAWKARVRALIQQEGDPAALAEALARWQPPTQQLARRAWRLDPDLALTLYQRDAPRFREFIIQTLDNPDITLFDEAEDAGDEELLDALTFAFLDQLATFVSTTYPYARAVTLRQFADKQRGWAQDWTQAINERFDKLVAQSPALYTRHAAHILSRGIGAAWKLHGDTEANPVAYLCRQHQPAWLAPSAALRDLLETPDLPAFELALDLLGQGGRAAAEQVAAALPIFMAYLLAPENSAALKRRILRTLEAAAAAGPDEAGRIAPLLSELMHYHSEQNLDERTMVSFVRARHYAGAQSA
jgi:hypothetical protein